MPWYLAPRAGADVALDRARASRSVKRFGVRDWTVDFPRPATASVVGTAADALRVDAAFTSPEQLVGLIWESVDRWDHPLTARATSRDYRGCVLRFRWRSGGLTPLDAVNGPVLTIEGRDASGAARTWYVRLWNYASGTPEDAAVTLDFDTLAGGFAHPAEADPLFAGDIDRMFISLTPPPGAEFTAHPHLGWAELMGLACDGPGSVIAAGDALVPESARGLATGYDDLYQLTPGRVWDMIEALGYAGPTVHYVGMSHFPALTRVGDAWLGGGAGEVLTPPARAWHDAFAREAAARGREVIFSLSFELFAAMCPPAWMQRAADGAPALTGWEPPSALLSPANAEAVAWLGRVMAAFAQIARDAGLAVKLQVGEPWWWVQPQTGALCAYDAATRAALGEALVPIPDLAASLSTAQTAMLDRLGELLSDATATVLAAAKAAVAPAPVETHLLAYLPSIVDARRPELIRANLPTGWASPAFDVLQLEDYDDAALGRFGASAANLAAAEARLGYPRTRQHYFAGFVLRPKDTEQWAAIEEAAARAEARGVAATIVWALPQVARDGFTAWPAPTPDPMLEDDVLPFADVDFPLALGREASVTTEFSTAIVSGRSGAEQRGVEWDSPRLSFDVGAGVRDEADVAALVAFYRARRGPAQAFRFRDPLDWESAAAGEVLGIGDGSRTDFALVKHYPGDATRRITRPVAASLRVWLGGTERRNGWTLAPGGVVAFAVAPAAGMEVRATFAFDVPVRFAEDRLEVSRATFLAGAIPAVPLIEVRE